MILKKFLFYFFGLLGLVFYCSGFIFVDRGNFEMVKKLFNSVREEVVCKKVYICFSLSY